MNLFLSLGILVVAFIKKNRNKIHVNLLLMVIKMVVMMMTDAVAMKINVK